MKAGHGEKLSRKMEQAIAALLSEPTIDAAAKVAGVSETTLWRWLQLSAFRNAYRDARRQVVEGVVTRLQKTADAAVETLERNLTCSTPAVEVAAAREILRQAVQGVELWDMAQRLDEMERRLGESNSILPKEANHA